MRRSIIMKKVLLVTLLLLFSGTVFSSFAQTDSYLKNRILVEGLYLRNLGNFSQVWSTAAGGYVGYSIAFPAHNLLMMRTGFISNSLRDNTEIEDASLTIIPLEIGGRYYFTDSRLMPFFQFINGLNIIFENINLEGEKEDKTLVKYSWQVGVGLTINLTDNFNVDVGANYQSNFYEKEAMNTGFEYVIGLGLAL
jgi:opacity protein-like surface antigen